MRLPFLDNNRSLRIINWMLSIAKQITAILSETTERKPCSYGRVLSYPPRARRGGWGHPNRGWGGVPLHPRGLFSNNDCRGGVGHLEAWGRGVEFQSGEDGEGSSNVQVDKVTKNWDLKRINWIILRGNMRWSRKRMWRRQERAKRGELKLSLLRKQFKSKAQHCN